MIIQVSLAIAIGITAGTITGLIPGIHVNLICAILLLIFNKADITIITFIISMAATHTFLDTIPSIFLGAPDSSVCELILPAHKMLLDGNGLKAYILTAYGSISSLILSVAASYFILQIIESFSQIVSKYIWIILILIAVFIISNTKNRRQSLFIYTASALLGLISFNLAIKHPLFHLLSGFFGISGLILSYYSSNKIPNQSESSQIEINTKTSFIATTMGFFASFLPGFGSSQAAIIVNKITKLSDEAYLILNGGLSTASMILSLITFYSLDKARNGAIVALSELIKINSSTFLFLMVVTLISGATAAIIGIKIAKIFSKIILKINYKLTVKIVIAIIALLSFILDGPLGILILITTTALGLICNLTNTPRNLMLGSINFAVIQFLVSINF